MAGGYTTDCQPTPMNPTIEPLNYPSLKAVCVRRLEDLILSGQYKIGERLPAERDLAASLDISRPVLHEAIVDLAAKGLVRIQPRRGVFVNDYRVTGSLAILDSLFAFHEDGLDQAYLQSLLDMRLLVETETARLAAANRSAEQLACLRQILKAERSIPCDPVTLTSLDFDFHLEIALASANQIYPLILNSFKGVYTHLTGLFFRRHAASPVVQAVHAYHSRLVDALERQECDTAAAVMIEMLHHGEQNLTGDITDVRI